MIGGDLLRQVREARGLELDDISGRTKISLHYLRAMEAEDFLATPAPVYLRSFLSGYCEYLEIDMRPLWDKLHPAPAPAEAGQPAPAPAGKPAAIASNTTLGIPSHREE